MGGVGPNSNSMDNGTEIWRPEDSAVSSGGVFSSVRTGGSESVLEVEREGSLELPPNRPLILSAN